MALVQCPECQRSVSDQATACPQCAHPLRRAPSPPRPLGLGQILVRLIFGGAIGIGILWWWGSGLGGISSGVSSATAGNFVVSMRGTSGTQFTLQCMSLQLDGSSASQSFTGAVPAEYPAKAHILSCVAQNKGADGRLTMQITKDGQILKTSDTSAAYGVVQVATQ
jgi:hypothetical protein